jgi:hypothetical protein
MGPLSSNPKTILGLLYLVFFVGLSSALKFELPTQNGQERCIRNFVSNGQLVVVTAIVSGSKGDGQVIDMHVCQCSSFSVCVGGH